MVYETYSRYPSRAPVTSYSVTTPRLYLSTERPGSHRSIQKSESSYTYKSASSASNDPYSRPEHSSYSSTYENSSRSGLGGNYNWTTERTSTTGSGPGGYSYSSSASGRLPGGTSYRYYSYRV